MTDASPEHTSSPPVWVAWQAPASHVQAVAAQVPPPKLSPVSVQVSVPQLTGTSWPPSQRRRAWPSWQLVEKSPSCRHSAPLTHTHAGSSSTTVTTRWSSQVPPSWARPASTTTWMSVPTSPVGGRAETSYVPLPRYAAGRESTSTAGSTSRPDPSAAMKNTVSRSRARGSSGLLWVSLSVKRTGCAWSKSHSAPSDGVCTSATQSSPPTPNVPTRSDLVAALSSGEASGTELPVISMSNTFNHGDGGVTVHASWPLPSGTGGAGSSRLGVRSTGAVVPGSMRSMV